MAVISVDMDNVVDILMSLYFPRIHLILNLALQEITNIQIL